METAQTYRSLLKKMLLRSAKFPLLLLGIGIILLLLPNVEGVLRLSHYWEEIYLVTDKLSSIFITLAPVIFIYRIFIFWCLYYEQKLSQGQQTLLMLIISSIRKGSRLIFLLIAINIIVNITSPSQPYLAFADHLIHAIIIGSIGWVILQVFQTIETTTYERMSSLTQHEQIRVTGLYTKVRILRNVVTVLVSILITAAILMSFDSVRNIGISLLASAGFITALVGLTAQKALFSLFAGIQLAMTQPIKLGDILVFENESGIVEEITLTYITLTMLSNRRRIVIPISYFLDRPFQNWSREESLRNMIFISVDYMAPIEILRQEFDKIVQQSQYWDGVAKVFQVFDITDRAVTINIQLSAATIGDLGNLCAEVREKLIKFMQDHYPHCFPTRRRLEVAAISSNDMQLE